MTYDKKRADKCYNDLQDQFEILAKRYSFADAMLSFSCVVADRLADADTKNNNTQGIDLFIGQYKTLKDVIKLEA